MKWMKIASIRAAARRSELSALKNCLRHHKQGRDATIDELRDVATVDYDIYGKYCAMCIRQDGLCHGCILFDEECCGGLWHTIRNAFYWFKKHPTTEHHHDYITAENKLCEYLETKIKGAI